MGTGPVSVASFEVGWEGYHKDKLQEGGHHHHQRGGQRESTQGIEGVGVECGGGGSWGGVEGSHSYADLQSLFYCRLSFPLLSFLLLLLLLQLLLLLLGGVDDLLGMLTSCLLVPPGHLSSSHSFPCFCLFPSGSDLSTQHLVHHLLRCVTAFFCLHSLYGPVSYDPSLYDVLSS